MAFEFSYGQQGEITLTNNKQQDIYVDISLLEYDFSDNYLKTSNVEEIIFYPPFVKLRPGEIQKVKVLWIAPNIEKSRTYYAKFSYQDIKQVNEDYDVGIDFSIYSIFHIYDNKDVFSVDFYEEDSSYGDIKFINQSGSHCYLKNIEINGDKVEYLFQRSNIDVADLFIPPFGKGAIEVPEDKAVRSKLLDTNSKVRCIR